MTKYIYETSRHNLHFKGYLSLRHKERKIRLTETPNPSPIYPSIIARARHKEMKGSIDLQLAILITRFSRPTQCYSEPP
jgi:hypothetical protein